jgi:putative secretion ATPase (PEP-CTERM system associated)
MYSEHYGLSERPFQLTPDPRFWFDSQTHRKAMAYLGYGLAQGEGFIVITGDIGAGKTTLVAHLLETIDRNRFNTVHIVSTQVEGDDMLRLVAQGIGLPTEGVAKAQILDRIERTLDDQARAGKNVLIIVDEAQNLPTSALEELRMLSNYQVANRSLVQIFLLGQPEFRDRVREAPELEQLRQRVIATHHLDPMKPDEVEPYIRHRLGQVGYAGNPEFTPEAFSALFQATGGVPRVINTLMARVMLHAALEDLTVISDDTVNAVTEDARAEGMNKRSAPAPAGAAPLFDQGRIAALEAKLEMQDAALRKVLNLLIGWIENDTARTHSRAAHSDAA